ncbi:MAG TPA: hypothetical protein VKA13_07505 [Gammaproteobacteria bacterium]|nr:hypothetical protein [Gammaproteobacteria bacterium]
MKHNRWGQNIRLEQERIAWDIVWGVVQRMVLPVGCEH